MIWATLAIERAYEEARFIAFIAEDKPDAALRWLDGLFDSTDRLRRFSQAGRIVPEIQLPDYREIIYGKRRVIYRVEKRRILILTVRRGRQLVHRSEILDEE